MTAQQPDGTHLTRCRTATVKQPQTPGEAGDPKPRRQLVSGLMTMLAVAMIFISAPTLLLAESKDTFSNHPTYYRTVRVDGVNIFYREAGPKDAPTLLLLHGFPSSSRMFMPLFLRLSDRYHLVAPDYPGFGHSDAPDPKQFAYTFDHIATVMNSFADQIGLQDYTLYLQDYGVPVGFRLALARPERVQGIIIQNGAVHEVGLGPLWVARRAFWKDRAAHEQALEKNFSSLEATRQRHIGNDPNVDLYDPDLWTDELAFLSQPGEAQIQSDLFYNYQTNVADYPRWQEWLRDKQPRLLVVWGKYDPSFVVPETAALKQDVPSAEVHILDAGHFVMDTKPAEVAEYVRAFLNQPRVSK